MKLQPTMRDRFSILLFLAVIFLALPAIAAAQTTAFSYQGRLNSGGTPANGNYEMEFKLFDALADGTQVGKTVTDKSVAVINGIFTTTLDFGAAAFDGTARYLEIGVRPAGSADPFTLLSPRQPINSAPYAIQAKNAATADNSTNSLQLGGIDASEYVTTTSVGNSFIKNDIVPQTGNFNISGSGIVGSSIGIGITPLPGFKLEVNGSSLFRTTGTGGNIQLATPNGETGITIGGTNRADIRFDSTTLRLFVGTGATPPTTGLIVNTLGNVATSGNLGVGTFAPDTRLTLNGGPVWTSANWTASMNLRNGAAIAWDANPSGRRWGIAQGTAGLLFFRSFSSFGTTTSPADYAMLISNEGNVGIGTITPTAKLEIVGTVKTNILQITGGSDLAENFEFGEAVKPGMVVAIDPRRSGKLMLARGVYNRAVVGIISGANNLSAGMILPDVPALNETKNSQPVALSGRAWVYADATRNPIKLGDLLTTSATPGYAMKVVNYKRAQGAIIGKAMTGLKSGTGLVLVLVSLQ